MKNLLVLLLAMLLAINCAGPKFNYHSHKTATHHKSSGIHKYSASDHTHHNSEKVKVQPTEAKNEPTETHKTETKAVAGTFKSSKKLKAVLMVGPVTSDTDGTTLGYVEDLKFAAKVLEANGVEVHGFYTPDNNWESIKKACEGANFLLYKGHGVYDGSNPPKWVGGFCLKGSFPSSSDISTELKLAPNAIIMISGCFTAGNAGDDIGKIELPEAKRRIEMYSKPFFDIKAACYYANWYPSAFHDFIEKLFANSTLGEAYKGYGNGGNPADIKEFKYAYQPSYQLFVGSEDYSGKTAFNNAFVGDPNKKLSDFF